MRLLTTVILAACHAWGAAHIGHASLAGSAGEFLRAHHGWGCPSPLLMYRLRGGSVYNASWEQSYCEGCPTIWAAARVGDLDVVRRGNHSEQGATLAGGSIDPTNALVLSRCHERANDRLGDIYVMVLPAELDRQHPDAIDDEGRTALHWAVVAGREEVVAELLRRQADPLKADAHGWNSLHLAASSGRPSTLAAASVRATLFYLALLLLA